MSTTTNTTWEVCEPALRPGNFEPLPRGMVSIRRGGQITAHAADLREVDIEHYAVVLADPVKLRVALRAPTLKERQQAVACSVVADKVKGDTGKRTLTIKAALRRLALEAPAVAGRYPLATAKVGDGDALVIQLASEA